ncbi:flavoprotein [Rhodococcus sp. NPDC127530]|uniref:flavoprotein n=1 Tax=unclassified Rhodococcus (in: high G+C Gram-positive bacteria) TaxID=192944 RepID=UPI00362902F3
MTDLPMFPVRRLLICASGGISSSLLPGWLCWLRMSFNDFTVRVALTKAAQQFVAPRALAVLSHHEIFLDTAVSNSAAVTHVELAEWAEAVVVAPATVNLIGKLANGIADDLVTTVLATARCPIVIAPSLPSGATENPALCRNLATLREDGYGIVPTANGISASSGEYTTHCMAHAPSVVAYLRRHLTSLGYESRFDEPTHTNTNDLTGA